MALGTQHSSPGSTAAGTTATSPILGAADHGAWQGTLVFDGARAFEGVTPDLDLHCARVVRSAEAMGLAAPLDAPRRSRRWCARASAGRRRPPALPPPDGLVARRLARDHRRAARLDRLRVCIEDLSRCPRPGRWRSPSRPSAAPRPTPPSARPRPPATIRTTPASSARRAPAASTTRSRSTRQGHVAETASTNVFLVRDGVVDDPGGERHLPRRHHPPARDPPPPRRRRRGAARPRSTSPTSPRPTRSSSPATPTR